MRDTLVLRLHAVFGLLRASPNTPLTSDKIRHILAALNGRARDFRYSLVRVTTAPSGTFVYDREDLLDDTALFLDRLTPWLHALSQQRRPWWEEDALASPALSEVPRTPRSSMGVPLLDASGAVVGVLCHFDDLPQPIDAAELDTLSAVGALLLRAWPTRVTAAHAQANDDHSRALERLEARHREREQWLSTTLASIGDAVIATDERGRVTYLNPVATELTGWSLHEAVGLALSEVFPIVREDTLAAVESPVDKVLREGRIVGLANHTFLRHRSGRLIPIEDSAAPIQRQGESLTGVVLVFRDATALREAERERERLFSQEVSLRQKAEEAEARSGFLLDVARSLGEGLDATAMLQRLANAVVPSRADFMSVWGVSPERQIRRLVHAPRDSALTLVAETSTFVQRAPDFPIQSVANAGRPLFVHDLPSWLAESEPEEAATARRLGVERGWFVPVHHGDVVVAVLALSAKGGRAFGPSSLPLFEAVARQAAVALFNAKLFAETRGLTRAAEQASLAKDQFLASVSHDLRNPLSTILGWVSLLRDRRHDPEQVLKGLAVIERSTQSQVQLTEDLLDVSRIVAGKMRLVLANEDVCTALHEALEPARLAASAKEVTLTLDCPHDVGTLAVDPDRFRQVVWNLAANAVKFTPRGGSVKVDARRDANHLEIAVTDTGRGIAPAFLPRVFAIFEQADAGSQRASGLGLGLSIVRHIVELHGGTIEVASEGAGKGSRFVVRFPIRAAVRPSEKAIRIPRGRIGLVLEGVRVVMVDDEQDAREVVEMILQQEGAVVFTASSADEALALVKRERPDLIVSDLGMPDKDGKAFIHELRHLSDVYAHRVPAVALTAWGRSDDRLDALAAGFTTHLTKPVDARELVLVVAGLLGRRLSMA